jgi:hypothetical protein
LRILGRPVAAPEVLSVEHGDHTVLLDLRRERYLVLDEVGTYVWARIVQSGSNGVSLHALVEALAGEFDAPHSTLMRDVDSLLDELSRKGVVEGVARGRVRVRPRVPSVLRCVITLAGVVLALRVLRLRRSIAIGRRLVCRVPTTIVPTPEFLARVVRGVDTAAAFFPGRALCLEQSFTLYLVLRWAGVAARLRIGAQPFPFAAHAWVECQGSPVGESYDRVSKFVPFEGLGL